MNNTGQLEKRERATQQPEREMPRSLSPIPMWLGVTCIMLVALDLRPGIVSIGPVLILIQQDFGLNHTQASLLTTIPDFLMGLLALPTPWLSRRFSRDRMILIALAILLVSMIGRSWVHNAPLLFLSTAGVGAGIAIAGALIAGFIKANYPKKAAFLMGLYATALSVGSTLSAATSSPIAFVMPGGWRFSTGIWGVLGIIGIGAWAVISFVERKAQRPVLSEKVPPPLPVRNKLAWRIALFFAISNLLFYAIVAWTAPMFHEYGLSQTRAGLLLASFTAVFTSGNPIFGALSRSHDRRVWLSLCASLVVLGLTSLAIAPMAAPFVWVMITALGLSGTFTLGMTLPLDNTETVEEANIWTAFTLTVGYMIAAFGPLSFGLLRDITGSFKLSSWVLVVMALCMLGLGTVLRPTSQI